MWAKRPPLTIGSLFSGIGGLDLGLERALGATTLYQVEYSKYCRLVLKKSWPSVAQYGDIKNVARKTEKYPSYLPYTDIICGGSPCQDLSFAGKGAGIEKGARSSLWFSMLKVIEVKRPKYVVWENVPGCVRRGLDAVVGGLRHLDYEVVGTRVRVSDVGGPHRRERVLVVAYSRGHQQRELQGQQQEGRRWAADSSSQRPELPAWAVEPAVARLVHGLPRGTFGADRRRALGNAVVPACAEVAGRLIRELEDPRAAWK